MIAQSFTATKDAMVLTTTSDVGAYGNGKGVNLFVGRTAGGSADYKSRALIEIPVSFAGIQTVSEAYLRVRVANACLIQGGSVRFWVEELSATFGENALTAACDFDGSGAADSRWPGPSASITNRGEYSGSPATGTWLRIPFTAMLEAARAAGKTVLRLRLIASNGTGYDEANAARTVVLSSAQSSYKPYLETQLDNNAAPTAPTVTTLRTLSDGSPVVAASTTGATATVDWTHNDPDPGDYAAARRHQVYADTATEAVPGTPVRDVTITSTGQPYSGSDIVGSLSPRTTYREVSQTQDSRGKWGPRTLLADGRFMTAYQVGVPANTYMQPGPDRPHIYGSISSADPADYVTGWGGEFYRQDPGGNVTLWFVEKQDIGGTPVRSDVEYGGASLNAGDKLQWRHWHFNRDGQKGTISPWYYRTVTTVTGPSGMSPIDRSTKLLSRGGPLVIADATAFDGYVYRLRRGGVTIYDSGTLSLGSTTSTTVTIPASAGIVWGDADVEWQAAIRPAGSGVLNEPSDWRPIRFNALPDGPVGTPTGIQKANGTWLATVQNFVITHPYSSGTDVAAFGEVPAAKEIEVRVAAIPQGSGALIARTTTTSGITAAQAIGTTPAWETSVDVRARYRDDATPKASTTLAAATLAAAVNVKVVSVAGLAVGDELTLGGTVETRTITAVGTAGSTGTGVTVSAGFTAAHTSGATAVVYYWGPQGSWSTTKVSQPLVVSLSFPASAATVTNPWTPLDWTVTSPGGKTPPQKAFVAMLYLRVGSDDQRIWSSGRVLDSVVRTQRVPPFLLTQSGQTIAWDVEIEDPDGLKTLSARRSFTTSFTAPVAPTNLTATPDPAAGAIDLAWLPSGSSNVWEHRLYWRTGVGSFQRIATLLNSAGIFTYRFYGGRIGTNEFTVTAHTSALEGEGATVAVDLPPRDGGQWQFVRGGEQRYTFAFDPEDAPRVREVGIETFRPPGGGAPVHLKWGIAGRRVSTRLVYIPTEDGDLATVFEELLAGYLPGWLKAPAGYSWDPLYVTVVSAADTPRSSSLVELAAEFEETRAPA